MTHGEFEMGVLCHLWCYFWPAEGAESWMHSFVMVLFLPSFIFSWQEDSNLALGPCFAGHLKTVPPLPVSFQCLHETTEWAHLFICGKVSLIHFNGTQVYRPAFGCLSEVVMVMSQYLEAVKVWMGKNRLQLNPVKLSGYELWVPHRTHSVSIFGSEV